MSNNLTREANVLNEVLSIWKDSDPVEGYGAGYNDCRGKLFFPNAASKADLENRIEKLKPSLKQIKAVDLRTAAEKLLDAIKTGLAYERPEGQILTCAFALWYALLKGEQKQSFIRSLVKQSQSILESEYDRWRDETFSGEVCKAGIDAIGFLTAVLYSIEKENPKAVPAIGELRKLLDKYAALFPFAVQDPSNLIQLFAYFRQKPSQPIGARAYKDILEHLYDYGVSAQEILKHGRTMLEEELNLIEDLISKLAKPDLVGPGTNLGTFYQNLCAEYCVVGEVVTEAQKMMKAVDRFIDRYVQDLGRPDVVPQKAPEFLTPLITSGATVALNYLEGKPLVLIYVVEGRNKSWLSLLNLLVHEATHGYDRLLLTQDSSVPTLAKLRTFLSLPLSEAAAFHRELQLFEAVSEESRRLRGLTRIRKGLLDIFETPRFPLQDDVNAFELETRVWRVIRALRTICDVEVNCGIRSYVEFVEWAHAKTGLGMQLIHNECFPFLANPGYSPAYSFCGKIYEDLESDAMATKMSRLTFNTKAHQMGLWPWTTCVEKMEGF